VATTLYADVPEGADASPGAILPLVRTAPAALAVADADGDGRTGITLARSRDALSFSMDAPTDARIQGAASGVVYVSTASLLASTVVIQGHLVVCDEAGVCDVIAQRAGNALVTILALPIIYDFGTIDVTVPAGGSLRLVLDVLAHSAGDALLSADALLSPTSITVVFR
jgi:hypothetical protein